MIEANKTVYETELNKATEQYKKYHTHHKVHRMYYTHNEQSPMESRRLDNDTGRCMKSHEDLCQPALKLDARSFDEQHPRQDLDQPHSDSQLSEA